MEDRRSARIGTVSGLALLTGATALVAVAGGHRSIFATLLLGLLAVGMSHALVVEIQRQARRRSPGGWGRHDTVNTVLLACWSASATALVPLASLPVRILGLLLAAGYATCCAYFVVERRRSVATPVLPLPAPAAEPSVANLSVTTPSVTDSTPSA
ncbi:hypothetical protein [Actinoplanes aureus]|uniref:hypothetical protein n=1 Tax=Actinoplanes aureus TaxID=2792083 RepID=UPI0028149A79|nr:hypothetical protein [Actinoplanes aureus]